MSLLKAQNRLSIENGKHIMVEEHVVNIEHPLHWHSFFEIEIVLSGSGKYVINDISYDIEKKNLFFLTSTDFHYLKVDSATRVINISFDETMVEEKNLSRILYSGNDRAYEFDEEEYKRLISVAEILRHECEIDGDCQKNLLQYILTCIFRRNSSKFEESSTSIQYRGIKNAINYMEIHFRENITLKRLAAEAGYNPTYFSELFKKITGESYVNALNNLRLGYAKTLLANGLSVTDACFMSGFSSLSGFFTTFKRFCKISPREYRTQWKKTELNCKNTLKEF